VHYHGTTTTKHTHAKVFGTGLNVLLVTRARAQAKVCPAFLWDLFVRVLQSGSHKIHEFKVMQYIESHKKHRKYKKRNVKKERVSKRKLLSVDCFTIRVLKNHRKGKKTISL
jgi:hypothetical protein